MSCFSRLPTCETQLEAGCKAVADEGGPKMKVRQLSALVMEARK